jgi:hypothetical protein
VAHDPTFFGWLTTGAYAATAATCLCAALLARSRREESRRASRRVSRWPLLAWFVLALGIALLGLNKQLDLQTAVTDRLRLWAERGEWYGHRRILQAGFVIAAFCITAGVLGLLFRSIGLRSRSGWCTFAGLGLLAVYLLLRIADIERMDQWLGTSLSAPFLSAACEWAGLTLVTIGAWRAAVVGDHAR